MDADIFTIPPTCFSVKLNFSRKLVKYRFASIIVCVHQLFTFNPSVSVLGHLKCYPFHYLNPVARTVRNTSGEKLGSLYEKRSCLCFAFVEDSHLFQFTASGMFVLFQKLIFQI